MRGNVLQVKCFTVHITASIVQTFGGMRTNHNMMEQDQAVVIKIRLVNKSVQLIQISMREIASVSV